LGKKGGDNAQIKGNWGLVRKRDERESLCKKKKKRFFRRIKHPFVGCSESEEKILKEGIMGRLCRKGAAN